MRKRKQKAAGAGAGDDSLDCGLLVVSTFFVAFANFIPEDPANLRVFLTAGLFKEACCSVFVFGNLPTTYLEIVVAVVVEVANCIADILHIVGFGYILDSHHGYCSFAGIHLCCYNLVGIPSIVIVLLITLLGIGCIDYIHHIAVAAVEAGTVGTVGSHLVEQKD